MPPLLGVATNTFSDDVNKRIYILHRAPPLEWIRARRAGFCRFGRQSISGIGTSHCEFLRGEYSTCLTVWADIRLPARKTPKSAQAKSIRPSYQGASGSYSADVSRIRSTRIQILAIGNRQIQPASTLPEGVLSIAAR